MSTLLEELALLSYDAGAGRAGSYLDLGLGGAALYELALAGRVGLDGKKVRVLDPTPTGDPAIDARLSVLAADRPRAPHAVVERFAKRLLPAVRDKLVADGVLLRERGRALGIFPVDRFPPRHRNAAAEARTRLASAVRIGGADERTAALLSLVAAVKLEKAAFPEREARPSRKELKAFAEAHWASAAARRAVVNREGASAAAGT